MADAPTDREKSMRGRVDGLMKPGRWEEVISLLSEHPGRDKDFHLAWSLGWAHFKQGDFDLASASLLVATRIDPRIGAGHGCLAFAYLERGDLDRAEYHFWIAISLSESGLGRLGLALVYMKKGDLRSAEKVHVEGLRTRPDSLSRIAGYADFLWDCARYADASAQYERAVPLSWRVRFTAKRVSGDRIYHLSEGEVRVVLSRLPERAYRRLRAVHFNDRSRGARVLGYANSNRGDVALCALPRRMSLTRFLVKGQRPEDFGAQRGVQWPELAIRRFLLYDTLLHELGHLQVVRPNVSSERRRYALERIARDFAMEWRARLGSQPFGHVDPVHNPPTDDE